MLANILGDSKHDICETITGRGRFVDANILTFMFPVEFHKFRFCIIKETVDTTVVLLTQLQVQNLLYFEPCILLTIYYAL